MGLLGDAETAWDAAASALDDACRALSAVHGAADQFAELSALADRTQREGRAVIERAIAASRKHAVDSLPAKWREG